jgi:hypothetical protein
MRMTGSFERSGARILFVSKSPFRGGASRGGMGASASQSFGGGVALAAAMRSRGHADSLEMSPGVWARTNKGFRHMRAATTLT